MDIYVNDFLNLVRNCSVDNTYKMAWGRALVEIAVQNPKSKKISLEEISKKVFKYYWNQTIYFDLIQGSNISKPPAFITSVKKEIDKYYTKIGNKQPKHFDRVEIQLDYLSLVRILKQDVSHRFQNLNGQVIQLYNYTKGEDFLVLHNPEIIAAYSEVLFEAINFRWTQILENFNSAPRIAKKVRVLDLPEIKRASLSKFKKYLDVENPTHECFICNKSINSETPSIDHIIPWSFLFSDDLWNLVYTCQSCNSKKSNSIPLEKEIALVEKRNINLLGLLKKNEAIKEKKPIEELEIAIRQDYIRKFWVNCK